MSTALSDAVSALRESRWADYETIIRELLGGGKEERIGEGMAAAHPAEINLFDRLSVWPNGRGRLGLYHLLSAIGKLPVFDLTDAMCVLESASRLEPSYQHRIAENIRPHIAKRPALGSEVGELLRTVGKADEAICRVWAGAFSLAAPQEAAAYVIRLLTGTSFDSQLLALLAHFLPFESLAHSTELNANEKKIADILLDSVPQQGLLAWTALTCIAEVSSSAMRHLLEALDAEEPQAARAMADALYRVKRTSVGISAEPLDSIVKRLLAIGLQNEQVCGFIDRGIESLLFQDALRPSTVPCLYDLCIAEENVTELFSATFAGLSDKNQDFAYVLTNWLLRPDATFKAIGGLLSRCTMQQAPVGLDAVGFAAASTERRLKAARRLLALTHNGPTLCQFIACIAEMTVLGTERLEIASQMLNEAFAEYPGATEDFLREKTQATSRSDPVAAVYRGVYANVLRWRRVLAKLPVLKELRPTDSELHVLRMMRQRVNRDILRRAAAQSIFADLVTSVHVAQGRRFASHTSFGLADIVEMSQASHSVELPSSEIADPMRGLIQRKTLLRNAR